MNKIIYLILLFLIAIILPLFLIHYNKYEGFINNNLNQVYGEYPISQNEILVQDTYPSIGKNEISNNNSNSIWWHYPTFRLGSYKQITNNIRYPNNPDIGRCTPASMCGALYREKNLGSNYITQLPPVLNDCGTRIGYFTISNQLVDSLPFRTNLQNILY
jgi:hypothetical protein